MTSIIGALESRKRFLSGKGISADSINDAEKALGLSFSDEYREYLLKFGIAAYSGHELTGISKSERTNVVNVTLKARKRYPEIPLNLYVIEETNVEEVVIWQSDTGSMFYSAPNLPLTKLCNTLCEYVLK